MNSFYSLQFENPKQVADAIKQLQLEGDFDFDVIGPFPSDELIELVNPRPTRLPLVALICGFIGGLSAFLYQYWEAAYEYALNVGGRAFFSWPAFMPVTFELTVLGASFGIFFGLFYFAGFPELHHPTFEIPNIQKATDDRFFLIVKSLETDAEKKINKVAQNTLAKETNHVHC